MRAPPGYLRLGEEGKVLKLLQSLYGLKQARFEWSKELEKFFLDIELTCSQVDQAVYFIVMEMFSSEPWFELNFCQTGPPFSPRSGLCARLDQWFS